MNLNPVSSFFALGIPRGILPVPPFDLVVPEVASLATLSDSFLITIHPRNRPRRILARKRTTETHVTSVENMLKGAFSVGRERERAEDGK